MGSLALCARISGPIVAGFFFLLGVLAFSIPCGQYDSNKDDRFEYVSPPKTIIAFHWMCCILGTTFGVCLFIASFGGFWVLFVGLCSAGLLFVFWVLYMAFFFLSDEYKMNDETVTMEKLKEMWADMLDTCPYADVYGTGRYSSNGKANSKTRCKTRSFRVDSEPYCNDTTTLLDLSPSLFEEVPALRVYHEVYPELTASDETYLSVARDQVPRCLVSDRRVYDPVGNIDYGVDPVPLKVLLTKDGKKPATVSRSRAIAAAIFFCGITYSYGIAKIPIIHQKVYKTNVTLKIRPTNEICTIIGACAKI